MGIFDFFKGKKKEKSEVEQGPVQNREELMGSLTMTYSSGIEAKVNFTNMKEYNGKYMQEAIVWYGQAGKEDARVEGKKVLLEPHIGRDNNNNPIYDTEEYYKWLCENGKLGAVKGFFKKEEVDIRDTNYLGILEFDNDGRAMRTEDPIFLAQYKVQYKEEKDRRIQERKDSDEKWRKSLEEQTNKLPKVVDNPDDHVVILTPDMLKDWEKESNLDKKFEKDMKNNNGRDR